MEKFSNLPNIGNTLEEQLNRAEISSYDELKKIGSKDAWLRIQSFDQSACYNRLCAIEGAIRNIPKNNLPDDVKDDLKAFYNEHKMSWK